VFNPTALLSINYAGIGDISPGQSLTKEQVASAPTITVTPANSSINLNGVYTLALVDADVVGGDISGGVTRHWLDNGVKVDGSTISNTSATAITSYAGPFPAPGSGAHRYVLILYEQPSSFTPPSELSQPNTPVSTFDLNDYVKKSNLGPLIAATYFTVANGAVNTSIPATSSVVTSTLLPQSSSQASSTTTSGKTTATDVTKQNSAKSSNASMFAVLLAGTLYALLL